MLKPSFDDLLNNDVTFDRSTWTHGVTLNAVSPEKIRDWNTDTASWKGNSSITSQFLNTCVDLVRRTLQRHSKGADCKTPSREELDALVIDRRTKLWTLVLLQPREGIRDPTVLHKLRLKSLFRVKSIRSQRYTLTPSTPSRWNLPLQRIHRSERAIPSELADEPCHTLTVESLSRTIQDILGSRYRRSLDKDLVGYLEDARRNRWDIGTLYARLRPWWYSQESFGTLLHQMAIRKGRDERLRKRHANSRETHIFRIPPRRVWDLMSNRVVPTSALNIPSSASHVVPCNMWAVSHSWVAQSDLHFGETSINQRQWPVPLPKTTTFDHIRIELLNMGAEYVFLDVLCLRQKASPDPESKEEVTRREEWSTDIPSLGHVYRHTRYQTVITYFNGLGLPFCVHEDALTTELYWLNRVWTLQETVVNWLPGGLNTEFIKDLSGRGRPSPFMRRMRESSNSLSLANVTDTPLWDALRFEDLLVELRRRPGYATKKSFDRVAALAYLLPYTTRPVYDEKWEGDEHAWRALVWNMPPHARLGLLVHYAAYASEESRSAESETTQPPVSWRPSWQQIMQHTRPFPQAPAAYPDKDERLVAHEDWGFYHQAYILPHWRMTRDKDQYTVYYSTSQPVDKNQIAATGKTTSKHFKFRADIELSEGVGMTLVGFAGLDYWVVGRESGTVRIGEHKAVVLNKVATGRIIHSHERNEIKELQQLVKKRYIAYSDPRK